MRYGEMSVTATVKAPDRSMLNRLAGAIRTNEAQKMTWLRIFLRIVSVGYLAAFIPWITLILLKAPILAPGGTFAPLLRFQPYNADYEGMLAVINVVWALMLWRASDDPAKHSMFIDFTIFASAAHGFVMIIVTPIQKGLPMTFIEGFPLFFLAAVLWWLRPGTASRAAPASLANHVLRGRRFGSDRAASPVHRPRLGPDPAGAADARHTVHRGRRFSRVSVQALSSIVLIEPAE